MHRPPDAPPMIRTDTSNPFAHDTMRRRLPAILRETAALNPDYPAAMRDAIERLAADAETNAPVPMLALPAPDYAMWAALYRQHNPAGWLDTEWFFAEFYAYRMLIQITRWWETGRDPFAPHKAQEYDSGQPWRLLARALEDSGTTPEDRLHSALTFALWSNRIDLSLATAMAHGGESTHADDLLADDRAAAVEQLLSASGPVHVVADNAGTELTLDLALVDALLSLTDAPVMLHVKVHPVFVSDATPADVLALVGMLEAGRAGAAGAAMGQRLRAAFVAGRLRIAPDLYWNSAYLLWDLPDHFADLFSGARMVILKGDANHRRALGDAVWPTETPFAHVTARFPAPLLTLRTLKSDVVVGLAPGMQARLDAEDAQWRVNGKRGVAQYKP